MSVLELLFQPFGLLGDWVLRLLGPWFLPVLVVAPVAGAVGLALVPRRAVTAQKSLALVLSLVLFLVSLALLRGFGPGYAMQFELTRPWLPAYGISLHVGVDGLSLWLVILTTFLTPVALLGSWASIEQRVKEFCIFMLLLEAGMIGVFVALDLFLFYIFWEAMLIPMYFLIGIWGHERRIYAAVKFFLYTMAGSVLMLVAFLVLYQATGVRSFDLAKLDGPAGGPAPAGLALRWPSRWPSPSRSPCSRSTPGCPTPTWRPPPPAR